MAPVIGGVASTLFALLLPVKITGPAASAAAPVYTSEALTTGPSNCTRSAFVIFFNSSGSTSVTKPALICCIEGSTGKGSEGSTIIPRRNVSIDRARSCAGPGAIVGFC